MRHIGTLPDATSAELFADYLLTEGIATRVEEEDGQFVIWIRDEQQVDRGRSELEAFLAAPQQARYTEASREAQSLRHEEQKREQQYQKNQINMRRTWQRPTLGTCRVTLALMLGAIIVSAWSRFGKDPVVFSWLAFGPLDAIFQSGQLWRLITPIFIHMGLLHLLFNLYWTYQFGLLIESRRGSARFLGLVLFVAIASNVAQYVYAGPYFGGLSGVGYGLFGYLWIKGRFDPAAGMQLPPGLVVFFLIWLVLCTTDYFGPVANTAHFVGMFAGIAVAGIPILLRARRS